MLCSYNLKLVLTPKSNLEGINNLLACNIPVAFLDRDWSRGQEDWINYLTSQATESQDFLPSVLFLIGTCPFLWQFPLNKEKHLSHWLFCSKLQKIHVHCVAFSNYVTGQLVHFIYFNLFVIVKQLTMVKNLLSTYYVSITERRTWYQDLSESSQEYSQVGSGVSHQLYRWEDGLAEGKLKGSLRSLS